MLDSKKPTDGMVGRYKKGKRNATEINYHRMILKALETFNADFKKIGDQIDEYEPEKAIGRLKKQLERGSLPKDYVASDFYEDVFYSSGAVEPLISFAQNLDIKLKSNHAYPAAYADKQNLVSGQTEEFCESEFKKFIEALLTAGWKDEDCIKDDAAEAELPPEGAKKSKDPPTKRRKVCLIVLAACVILAVTAVILLATKRNDRGTRPIRFADEITDHLVLSLENADHQYEVGLENWRRLDYNRAERDILAARNEMSESISQANASVAVINNSLGCLYLDMGRYQDAYDYLNHAYVTLKDLYGDAAPETLAALFAIAQYDYCTGDIETAQKTLQAIMDTTGSNSRQVILSSAQHLRAQIYEDLGQYDSAVSAYLDVLDLYEEILQDGALIDELAGYANDPKLSQTEKDAYTAAIKRIALTYHDLGRTYLFAGNLDAAETALNAGLALCVDNIYIGTKNLVTSKLYMEIADLCAQKGEIKAGIDAIDLAMRIQRNLFDFEDVYPGLVEIYDVYGGLLYDKGSVSEAADYYNNAVELAMSAYGKEHPITAEALYFRGVFSYKNGETSKAQKDLETAIEIRKDILGYRKSATAKYLYQLALVLAEQSRGEAAFSTVSEAKEICELLHIEGTLTENVDELYLKLEH